jgi:phosphoglycerate dehydrogenase-like enzyme
VELAKAFSAFYRDCRVVDVDAPALSRPARLLLCRVALLGLRENPFSHRRQRAGEHVEEAGYVRIIQSPGQPTPCPMRVWRRCRQRPISKLPSTRGCHRRNCSRIIPQYDALLVRSATRVTAELIQAGKRLRVIGRAGVGVDNIDVDAATQAGVIVVNAPTGNVVAAAEHTIAMLMALARNIPQADAHVRAGLWKRDRFMGVEVRDKVLGTVGLGRVAQEVVRRAQGLGMRVIAYDPYVTAEYATQRGVTLVDLDTLVAEADFITLHVPLTAQTRT